MACHGNGASALGDTQPVQITWRSSELSPVREFTVSQHVPWDLVPGSAAAVSLTTLSAEAVHAAGAAGFAQAQGATNNMASPSDPPVPPCGIVAGADGPGAHRLSGPACAAFANGFLDDVSGKQGWGGDGASVASHARNTQGPGATEFAELAALPRSISDQTPEECFLMEWECEGRWFLGLISTDSIGRFCFVPNGFVAQGAGAMSCTLIAGYMVAMRKPYDTAPCDLGKALRELLALPKGSACAIMTKFQVRANFGPEPVFLGDWLLQEVKAWRLCHHRV